MRDVLTVMTYIYFHRNFSDNVQSHNWIEQNTIFLYSHHHWLYMFFFAPEVNLLYISMGTTTDTGSPVAPLD